MKKIVFFVISCVVFSGCVSAGRYRMKVDELSGSETQVQLLNTKVQELEQRITLLENEKASLEKTNAGLTDALSATKNKKDQIIAELSSDRQQLSAKINDYEAKIQALNKEKEEAISSLKNTYDSLVKDMQDEIKQGEVQITQLEGKLTVNMVDKILFDSGQSEVKSQGKNTLVRVGAILKKQHGKQIRIEGHTDNVPISANLQNKFPTNWELSTARATNVARYLIDKAGLDQNIISVSGYSDTRPIADNNSVEGRAKNRRIEIILLPLENNATSQALKKP
jgi:chemotaxis protein MotB